MRTALSVVFTDWVGQRYAEHQEMERIKQNAIAIAE